VVAKLFRKNGSLGQVGHPVVGARQQPQSQLQEQHCQCHFSRTATSILSTSLVYSDSISSSRILQLWTEGQTSRRFHSNQPLGISELNTDSKMLEKVTIVEMKRFLRKQELPFVDGYTCLRLDCLFCKKGSRKKKTFPWENYKLFINKKTGKK